MNDISKTTKTNIAILLYLVLFIFLSFGLSFFVAIPSTISLIIFNVLIFLFIFNGRVNVKQLWVSGDLVERDKEYYRIITSAFTHEQPMHILMNMYSLYSIGSALEIMLGSIMFSVVYFVIGVVGGIIAVIIHHRLNPAIPSIGASGIICGLLGVYLVLAIQIQGFNAIINIAPTLILLVMMSFSPRIDSVGHFSGLAIGVIAGFLLVLF